MLYYTYCTYKYLCMYVELQSTSSIAVRTPAKHTFRETVGSQSNGGEFDHVVSVCHVPFCLELLVRMVFRVSFISLFFVQCGVTNTLAIITTNARQLVCGQTRGQRGHPRYICFVGWERRGLSVWLGSPPQRFADGGVPRVRILVSILVTL